MKLVLALMLVLVTIMIVGGSEETPTIVQASDVLAKIKSGQPADFDICIIVGNLNLSAVKIGGTVHFNRTLFQDLANFNSTNFNGDAYFYGSNFNGHADFIGSNFNGDAYFDGSSFNGHVDFTRSSFNGHADFIGTNFNGNAYFERSSFNGDVDFTRSSFNGHASFICSKFNEAAYFCGAGFNYANHFDGSCFNGAAEFGESSFSGYTNFEGSSFTGNAHFEHSKFNDYAYLGSSNFNGNTYFKDSSFNGDTYFSGSGFKGTVNFEGSRFNIIVYTGAQFNKETSFDDAQFNKEASFDDAKFNGTTSFNNSRFKDDALFESANFNCTLYLIRTKYDKLYIRWRDIKNLAYDDATYLSLMENFKKLGYIEDYDSCYYEYRKEHRTQNWSGGFHGMSNSEEWIRKKTDFVLEWSYGYGKKPLNPIVWSIVTIILFGAFWGIAARRRRETIVDEYQVFNEHLQDKGLWDKIHIVLKPFIFSTILFLSGTKLFVDPPEVPDLPGLSKSLIKGIFIAERVLGAFYSILIVLAIGATIVRQ